MALVKFVGLTQPNFMQLPIKILQSGCLQGTKFSQRLLCNQLESFIQERLTRH